MSFEISFLSKGLYLLDCYTSEGKNLHLGGNIINDIIKKNRAFNNLVRQIN
jgi:hypothetical protein